MITLVLVVQDLEKPGVDEDPQQVLLRYQVRDNNITG